MSDRVFTYDSGPISAFDIFRVTTDDEGSPWPIELTIVGVRHALSIEEANEIRKALKRAIKTAVPS
jgi:hypothetical protein